MKPQHSSHRLEELGQLACGVAHDVNNLLTVILSSCEEAQERLVPGDPVLEPILEIVGAARQGAALTRRLLAVARGARLPPGLFDLGDLVRDSGAFLARLLGKQVSLRLDVPRGTRPVMGDPGQIHQVLLNLAVNARDAMPGGGVLTLELRDVSGLDPHLRRRDGAAPGPHVVLAVTDTGTGIDEATRARMFEPFFTTKAPGHGTGLGLAIVQAIVAEAGGFIEVATRRGAGTRFEIYLPASAVTAPAEP